MTPDAFSILAARVGHGVVTYPILDAVQYRFGGKAFATLGWPAAGWAVIKLDPPARMASVQNPRASVIGAGLPSARPCPKARRRGLVQ